MDIKTTNIFKKSLNLELSQLNHSKNPTEAAAISLAKFLPEALDKATVEDSGLMLLILRQTRDAEPFMFQAIKESTQLAVGLYLIQASTLLSDEQKVNLVTSALVRKDIEVRF